MIILMTFKNVFLRIFSKNEIYKEFIVKRFFNLNYKVFAYPGSMLYLWKLVSATE